MFKKILKIAGGIIVALIVVLFVVKAYRDAHYFDNYDPKAPLNVTVLETQDVNKDTPDKAYTITKFTIDGYHGEKVPALMSVPVKRPNGKFPAILFLHGIGQNKNFLKEITAPFNECGFVFVSFDQYMQGERKVPDGASGLDRAKAFLARPGKTINEARRMIDYLAANSDIDPQRIYLVGASYGAITGSTVLAKDKRIRAGILVYGGGDLGKLLDSPAMHLGAATVLGLIDAKRINIEKEPLPTLTRSQYWRAHLLVKTATVLLRYFMGVSDPIHYVGQIAPTPVYFQNGTHDILVPPAAGKALQEASKDVNRKITWYDSDHVGFDVAQTKQVLLDALKWLVEEDDPMRPAEDKVKEIPAF